jgi:hypothetical protein
MIRDGFESRQRVVALLTVGEVMGMHRYLLVLEEDLLTVDEELGLEPINYLVARQEQEPCEVVVLSLVDTGQPAVDPSPYGNFLGAVPPNKDERVAEHRKDRAVRYLRTIGCKASGFISGENLVRAVRSETGGRNYDQVILPTGRQVGTWLARVLRWDPIHRLRRRWGRRLIAFPLGPDAPHPMPSF